LPARAAVSCRATLADSARLLVRRLTNEEDLIVPVILAPGPDRLSP
jgi:hypothetical protein